tara:strand:+ start:26 stop:304 length:279 start_codon:yes stop_codon:yes gene_type:complete
MDITRRQFLKYSSIASTAIVMPKVFISAKQKLHSHYNNWKGFSFSDAANLDKYQLNEILPSLISMLVFAYLAEIEYLISAILTVLFLLIMFF